MKVINAKIHRFSDYTLHLQQTNLALFISTASEPVAELFSIGL